MTTNPIEKEMDAAIDAIGKHIGKDDINSLRAELAAYKRAKAENDERFMNERDQARAEAQVARADANGFLDALEEIRKERDTAVEEFTKSVVECAALRKRIVAVPPVINHVAYGGYRPNTDAEQIHLAIETLKIENDYEEGKDLYMLINTAITRRYGLFMVLKELVDLKEIHDELERNATRPFIGNETMLDRDMAARDYRTRKDNAWNTARALIKEFTK